MSAKAFEEFVQRKAAGPKGPSVDWARRRAEWLQKLDELYALIGAYLKPYTDQGDVKVERRTVVLEEEHLGRYEAAELLVAIGDVKVLIRPVGTEVFAAHGRVEVVGPWGAARLLLVEPGAWKPPARFKIRRKGSPPPPDPQEVATSDCVWKFIADPPSVQLFDLNADSFFEAMVAVADG